jgi:hypothetical protein
MRGRGDKGTAPRMAALLLILIIFLAVISCAAWVVACDSKDGKTVDGETTSSTEKGESESGDIEGVLGEEIKVGDAIITVRALQATFQPAIPEQRLSEQTPSAPAAGESFYQAYVRVENKEAVTPIRVDPEDFACAVGDAVVGIEPTRSGPFSRSLLKNTSLDLLLTFKAPAGFEPILIYSPPWHKGVIRVSPEATEPTEETTTTS